MRACVFRTSRLSYYQLLTGPDTFRLAIFQSIDSHASSWALIMLKKGIYKGGKSLVLDFSKQPLQN